MARTDARNSARYWQDPEVPGLSLLSADFTTHEYAPHSHEAYVVAVTERGGAEFRSRGLVDQAVTSTLLVFNPDEPHSGRLGASERWRYRSFYLTESAIGGIKDALGLDHTPYFSSNAFRDEALIADFLALHRAIEAGEGAFAVRSHLYLAFGRLFERHASRRFRPERASSETVLTNRIIAYLRVHHAEEISLDALAARFGLTPFRMIRCFNRTLGLPPHACLTQIRLNAACDRLKKGESFAGAALAAGFYDQSAFNRHFKRSYGITPGQFVAALV